jgi:hypothetical protein
MAKRLDNDATMEMSTSQLVPDQPRGDVSVWNQKVVSSDQFAPTPAPTGSGKRVALWIFVAFVVFAAVAIGTVVFLGGL